MTVAAVNFEVGPIHSEGDHLDHLRRALDATDGADLVVFPECVCLELLGAPGFLGVTPREAPARLGAWFVEHSEWFRLEASGRGQDVLFGTQFVPVGTGVQNCAVWATAGGRLIVDIPKVVMTQFELHEWGVEAGRGLRRLPDPRVGVTVCYDSEFPASGRALAEAGVLVQAVPAYTETRRGFQRVRWCALARAVENQVFVVHASLVGGLGREPLPQGYGTSAVIAPSVEPFPEEAVLAETGYGEGVARAELDFDALAKARSSGDVRNWDDRDRGDWTLRDPATFER